MSILLEVQKYNHYRILQESYVPKEVKFAITEDKKYVIVDSELFDIEKNESLGLYYESRLLKEEIITESWFETIADIAVGVGSAALAATGVGVAAAQAIDVLHGLSFIYRGNTRNDKVLTVMGYFSLALALFPALGTVMKNILVAMAKKFVGKPIASLIRAIAKSKVGVNIVKKLQGMISGMSSKVGQFNNWAKQYKWFDKIWSKIGSSFAGGLKYFDDFLGKVVKESGSAKNLKNWKELLQKGQVVSSKGGTYAFNSPQGRSIISANTSKYIDDIVFDAKTGEIFLKNSDEGIEAIARNNNFLGGPGLKQKPSDLIPDEFLKVAKKEADEFYKAGTLARQSGKAAGEAGETAGKSSGKAAGEAGEIAGKRSRLASTADKIYKSTDIISKIPNETLQSIVRYFPIGTPLLGGFRGIFRVLSGKMTKKELFLAIGGYIAVLLSTDWLHDKLCKYGIKNKSQLKSAIKKSKEKNIEWDPDQDTQSSLLYLWDNLDNLIGPSFVKRVLLMGDCGDTFNPVEFFIDTEEAAKEIGGEAGKMIQKNSRKLQQELGISTDEDDENAITVED